MRFLPCFLVIVIFHMAPEAAARVFNYKTHTFAAYFKGTAGVQDSAKTAFGSSSGTNTRFDDEVDYNFSGEFGFVWNMSEKLVVRLAGEFVQTKNEEIVGTNTGGTKIMDIESSAKAFNPQLIFEYVFSQVGTLRYFAYVGAGYAQATVTNSYTNNTSGTGDTEYKEVVTGNELSYVAGVGAEFSLFDNATMVLDAGYRMLEVSSLSHEDTVNTVNGTRQKGSTALNNDGSERSVNLDGAFVGLAFRFYIPPIKF